MFEIAILGAQRSLVVLSFALGLFLTFGLGGVGYLAYGTFFILGIYFVITLLHIAGAIAAILGGIAGLCLVTFLFYRFLLSRVEGNIFHEAVICLGVVLILSDGLLRIYGTRPYPFPELWSEGLICLSGFAFQKAAIYKTGPLFLVIVGVYLYLNRSISGKAMRALSQNRDSALLMGISPTGTVGRMMVIGSIISMITGILYFSSSPVNILIGDKVLLESLFAIILGGMGSFKGLCLASFIIGFSEVIIAATLGPSAKMLAPVILVLVILLLRPSGMFGKGSQLEERL